MREELKPCPFCGGRAVYDTNGNERWVICLKCGAMSRKTHFDDTTGRKLVADSWNRRTECEK